MTVTAFCARAGCEWAQEADGMTAAAWLGYKHDVEAHAGPSFVVSAACGWQPPVYDAAAARLEGDTE